MSGNNITISRKPGNNEKNYFMMVSKAPMDKFKFKMMITGICTSDRFLDMGLVSETRKNECTNLINRYGNAGNYCYCGYSQTGVSGPMLASSSSQASGFDVGIEIFYEFDGSKFLIYTEDRKADMQVELSPGNYYFYFVLYHPEASCSVEQL